MYLLLCLPTMTDTNAATESLETQGSEKDLQDTQTTQPTDNVQTDIISDEIPSDTTNAVTDETPVTSEDVIDTAQYTPKGVEIKPEWNWDHINVETGRPVWYSTPIEPDRSVVPETTHFVNAETGEPVPQEETAPRIDPID